MLLAQFGLRQRSQQQSKQERTRSFSTDAELLVRIRALAPGGIDHIVEVAFGANIERDLELLKMGGSIATYATNAATPTIPFWPMVFKNIHLFFLGSDDFPPEAKAAATRDINAALEAGWPGFAIGERLPLAEIARRMNLPNTPRIRDVLESRFKDPGRRRACLFQTGIVQRP
jgi:NADPH:quinone reductase-like Zn-dependent oxidoreductase